MFGVLDIVVSELEGLLHYLVQPLLFEDVKTEFQRVA